MLLAIAATGPTTELRFEALQAALGEVLAEGRPARRDVVRVLVEMTKMARRLGGEPVVDYIQDEDTLHIADPYFAFYLRWGETADVTDEPHAAPER